MSLGYEFAPIDVSIIVHDKVMAIPRARRHAAFGLWCWGQCYARMTRSEGRLKRSAVLASLAAEVGQALRLAADLVACGLWHESEDGWAIHNFEKKSSRQSSSTARMRKLREKRKGSDAPGDVTCDAPCDAGDVTPVTRDASPVTGCSSSPSYSSSGSDLEEGVQGEAPASSAADPPPEWFAEVVSSVETSCIVDLRTPECWLRYAGHRAGKGRRPSANDARYWLTTVMVPEARKEAADAVRQRERDKRFADHRPKYDKATPAQSTGFTKSLQARMLEELAAEAAKDDAKKGAA